MVKAVKPTFAAALDDQLDKAYAFAGQPRGLNDPPAQDDDIVDSYNRALMAGGVDPKYFVENKYVKLLYEEGMTTAKFKKLWDRKSKDRKELAKNFKESEKVITTKPPVKAPPPAPAKPPKKTTPTEIRKTLRSQIDINLDSYNQQEEFKKQTDAANAAFAKNTGLVAPPAATDEELAEKRKLARKQIAMGIRRNKKKMVAAMKAPTPIAQEVAPIAPVTPPSDNKIDDLVEKAKKESEKSNTKKTRVDDTEDEPKPKKKSESEPKARSGGDLAKESTLKVIRDLLEPKNEKGERTPTTTPGESKTVAWLKAIFKTIKAIGVGPGKGATVSSAPETKEKKEKTKKTVASWSNIKEMAMAPIKALGDQIRRPFEAMAKPFASLGKKISMMFGGGTHEDKLEKFQKVQIGILKGMLSELKTIAAKIGGKGGESKSSESTPKKSVFQGLKSKIGGFFKEDKPKRERDAKGRFVKASEKHTPILKSMLTVLKKIASGGKTEHEGEGKDDFKGVKGSPKESSGLDPKKLLEMFKNAGKLVSKVFKTIFSGIKNIVPTLLKVFSGLGGSILAVLGAAFAGYQIGKHIVNPLINDLVKWITGDATATLGTAFYDMIDSIKDKIASILPAALTPSWLKSDKAKDKEGDAALEAAKAKRAAYIANQKGTAGVAAADKQADVKNPPAASVVAQDKVAPPAAAATPASGKVETQTPKSSQLDQKITSVEDQKATQQATAIGAAAKQPAGATNVQANSTTNNSIISMRSMVRDSDASLGAWKLRAA